MIGRTLHCDLWNGHRFETETEFDIADLDDAELSITHFYGYAEVQYKGIIAFAFGRTFFLPYLKVHFVRAIESIDQYFFNKKKLVTKQRIDLLRFLVARKLEGQPISSPVDLMTGLYSIKWVLHPERDPQKLRLQFYLNSLIETGELEKTINGYELNGKALQAIEVYEEQERKHAESIKSQRRMVWLTLAIALLTAAQAGLFKLPTLLDLRNDELTPCKSERANGSTGC